MGLVHVERCRFPILVLLRCNDARRFEIFIVQDLGEVFDRGLDALVRKVLIPRSLCVLSVPGVCLSHVCHEVSVLLMRSWSFGHGWSLLRVSPILVTDSVAACTPSSNRCRRSALAGATAKVPPSSRAAVVHLALAPGVTTWTA